MTTDPVNTPAAHSPGPKPNPMETTRGSEAERQAHEFERVEHTAHVESETPPPQTWKYPDDGKSLSPADEELPLKP